MCSIYVPSSWSLVVEESRAEAATVLALNHVRCSHVDFGPLGKTLIRASALLQIRQGEILQGLVEWDVVRFSGAFSAAACSMTTVIT